MATCENCGSPGCAHAAGKRAGFLPHVLAASTAACERRAKERALAEVARLTAERDAARAKLDRVREACKPEYIPRGYEPVVTVGRNRLRAEILALLGEP